MFTTGTHAYSDVLEKVITPTALVLIDGDVVKTYLNPDVEINDQSADENIEAIWDLIKNRKVYHLIVPDATTHITVEAHNYRNLSFESIKKGEALIIKTLGHRILAKIYVTARKQGYPVHIFENEQDAMAWFDSLRMQEDKA
ncbi:MAG: hypothetical protein K9G41_05300 [Flavobacteriales bacterium]|nr:hypothetical protein [Flavobacteriales bacterium]